MKRTLKRLLSSVIVASMLLTTCVFSGMNFDILGSIEADAANTATLNVTANTSGTLFDSKGNYLNLWQAGASVCQRHVKVRKLYKP